MNVAILGGSGLLGRHISAALLGRGDRVIILSRDPGRVRGRLSPGAVVTAWSVEDPAGLATTLDGVDAVINLAGVPVGPRPWTAGRRRAILRSRLDATGAIVAAIARLPLERRPSVLVSASGIDSYTGLDATPATEASPSSDGFLARVCLAWEAEAGRARELGARVAILRIGFVLARDAAVLRLYALPFRLHLGGPLGDGRQWMTWVHVDDVVGLFLFALDDRRVDGIVNAVAPEPARQAQVAAAIGAALHRRSWLPIPAQLIRLGMGGASTLALGSRRVVPERATDLGYRFRRPDLRSAVADAVGSKGART